jgi:hypothetical protein
MSLKEDAMLKSTIKSLLIVCLLAGTLSAANDPFTGKWKLNQSKSKITGEQVKITALGGNKYRITIGNVSDTIVADGTDQPIHFGDTESIRQAGPNAWTQVIKKNGRVHYARTWTLAQDGRTVTIQSTETRPDGSTSSNHFVFTRTSGTTGFGGIWEMTTRKIGSPAEQVIQPYGGDGLSFIWPADQDTLSMKFDGKDYPETGPNVAAGSASSGRRVDQRTLEMTDKIQGKVMDTQQLQLSPDLNTLTVTIHETGQSKPLIAVYDRD